MRIAEIRQLSAACVAAVLLTGCARFFPSDPAAPPLALQRDDVGLHVVVPLCPGELITELDAYDATGKDGLELLWHAAGQESTPARCR